MARSAAQTVALVELYTSDNCSRCPAAERWLSSLQERGSAVIPLALHVDYADYIGHPRRQRKLTPRQRLALVYSPQVVLQGRDFRGWATPAFDEAVARINARPARAKLSLEIVSMKGDTMVVQAGAELVGAAEAGDAALYLATYESRLENVVLEWQGPTMFLEPRLVAQRQLALLPKARPERSGVVGFVQSRRTGEVLQALMLPACP
ncbi:MAG TPA: DUF1223 domain-containing protein [Burkholderiales bacterium]|nr:DUF1223 domain-containing protein [Burkholderiales bacterium]